MALMYSAWLSVCLEPAFLTTFLYLVQLYPKEEMESHVLDQIGRSLSHLPTETVPESHCQFMQGVEEKRQR